MNRSFIIFVGIGGFASLVNLCARMAINQVTSYGAAIVLAFPIALLTAFILNRLFVFKVAGRNWRRQLLRFLAVNLVALVQVYAISMLCVRVIFPAIDMDFHSETIGHAVGLCSPILTTYWAHKHFTFMSTAVPVTDG